MIEALAWPVVGFLLGLVIIGVLRGPIVRKIDGIRSASRDGISFDRPQEVRPNQPEVLAFEALMRHPISATVIEREEMVGRQLKDLQLKTDSERISLLLRVVAKVTVELEFTRVAHTIFGSQLRLLVRLASSRQGLSEEQVKEEFSLAKLSDTDVHGARTFDDWLSYMLNSNLIVKGDDRIDLTQFGTDFLKFLVDARLTYDRRG